MQIETPKNVEIAGRVFSVGTPYYGGTRRAVRIFRGPHPRYHGLICYEEPADNDQINPLTPNAWARWVRDEVLTSKEEANAV